MSTRHLETQSARPGSQPRALLAGLLCLAAWSQAGAQVVNQWNTTATPASWATAANWSLGTLPGPADTAAFTNLDLTADTTVTLDGNQGIGSLVFGDLAPATAGSWIVSTGSVTTAVLTLTNLATLTANPLGTGKTVQLNVPLAAVTNAVTFYGPGNFTLTAPSTYTNSTILAGGVTLNMNVANEISKSTNIIFQGGGTLTCVNSSGFGINNIVCNTGQTGNIYFGNGTSSRLSLPGTMTGGGTLNLYLYSNVARDDFSGNYSGFTGTVNLYGPGQGRMYINGGGFAGWPNAAVVDNAAYLGGYDYSQGNTVPFGSLAGTNAAAVITVNANGGIHLVVGSLNTSTTFAGQIQGAGATGSTLTKVGTGTLTLSGATNNYNGFTLVSAGALYGQTGGAILGNSNLTVAAGATFGVQVATSGGHWSGTNLFFSSGSSLVLNYGSVVPSTTVAPLLDYGLIAATNTVTASVLGGSGWTPGVYPLVKYTNGFGGNGFAALNLGTLPLRVVGVLSNDTANSAIDLVVSAVNEPLKWAAGSGTWDLTTTANWKDATGTATTYQQQIGVGDLVVLEDTASGPSPITVTLATNVSPASVTFSNATKAYTLAGPGGITGATGLTKQGSGVLTLTTTNAFSGPVNLNGGTVNFASLANNLGTGTAINFSGGTLQYAAGATDDLSVRTVTIAANGATIDTGAGTVTLANGIGNNGSGSLTKAGTGSLTLKTNNTYTGATVINAGTLVLGASLSNSAAIVVNAGATLNAAANNLYLNGANSQILAGGGTITGVVTTAAGAVITPGTNGTVGTLTLANDLNLNGGTYYFDVATTNHDLIVVGGALNIQNPAGGILSINPLNALTNGTYKLVQYSGAYNSGLAGLAVAGTQTGKIFALADTTSGEIDLVVSSAGSASLKWLGDGVNNFWDVNNTADWLNGTSPDNFINGDVVTFDDTGSLSPSVDIESTPVSPGSVVVNTVNTYTFTGSKLTGSGTALTKNNTGTLVLANAGNDYGGTTWINGGTLQVGDGSTAGTTLGVGPVINNASLIFNQPDNSTVFGSISGTGSLAVDGSGLLTLLGNNTYAGLTTIDTGALQVGNGGLSGTLGTNAVALLNGSSLIIDRAGTYTLANGISGNGQVAFAGAGTVSLGGFNTYLNNTILTNGTVKLATNNALPFGGATTGWLVLDGGATAGTLDLSGHNLAVNALSGLTGSTLGLIVNNSSGLSVLDLGTPANTTYAGLIKDNNNSGTGQVGLEIDGDGTGTFALTLSGLNNFSGPVLINGGKLILGNNGGQTAIGTGPVTLANNGTLQMAYYGSGANAQGGFVNSILVPAGTTGNLFTLGRGTYSGSLTVHGTLNLTTSFVRSAPSGNWSASDGQINILAGTAGGIVYLNNAGNINWGTAAINLGSGVLVENSADYPAPGNTFTIGELTGTGTITDSTAVGPASRITTYVVGGRNSNATFDGSIVNLARATGINKVGTGSWTLTGNDTYSGPTTVSSGSLVIASGAFMTASPVITVNSGALLDVSSYGGLTLSAGQTLAGAGSITGAVTMVDTDILQPGSATVAGTLTFANGLTETSTGVNVTNSFALSSDPTGLKLANSQVAVTGDLTLTGTNPVVITPLNTLLGAGTYTLFKYTGNLNNEGGVVPVGTLLTNNLQAAGAFAANADVSLVFSNASQAIVVIVQPTAQNLTWVGGLTNNWDLNVSSNWLKPAPALANFLNYDNVTFGDSSNLTVAVTGTLAPSSITVNSASNYVFNGAGKITATTGLMKTGVGTLTLGNTGGNDYTGPVAVNGGTLKLGVATALGATNGNTVVANGATLDLNGFAPNAEPVVLQGSGVGGNGAIVNNGAQLVNAGFTGNVALAGDATFGGSNRWDIYNGSFTGNNHNLTKVGSNYIVLTGLGDLGVSNITVQAGYFTLVGNTTLGSLNGVLNLAAGGRVDLYATTVTNYKPVTMNGATLSSSSGTNIYGGPISLGATEIFTANTPLGLNGALGGSGALYKNGAASLLLAGTNTYTGATTVAAGTLALTGYATIANSATVDVNAGALLDVTGLSGAALTLAPSQTLKGAGSVNGSLTAGSASVVAPGESAVGVLTVSNSVTLGGNAVFAISKGSTPANSSLVAATIRYGGTLTLTNLGAAYAAGDAFKLFTAGTLTGAFTSLVPATPGAGLLWNTNSLATGTLAVIAGATVNPNPPPLLSTLNGSQLILSWPTNTGWTLQTQTNPASIGLSNNWVSWPGSALVNAVTNTVDATKGSVFYRLVYTNTP